MCTDPNALPVYRAVYPVLAQHLEITRWPGLPKTRDNGIDTSKAAVAKSKAVWLISYAGLLSAF